MPQMNKYGQYCRILKSPGYNSQKNATIKKPVFSNWAPIGKRGNLRGDYLCEERRSRVPPGTRGFTPENISSRRRTSYGHPVYRKTLEFRIKQGVVGSKTGPYTDLDPKKMGIGACNGPGLGMIYIRKMRVMGE
jgi:hypothetical protein